MASKGQSRPQRRESDPDDGAPESAPEVSVRKDSLDPATFKYTIVSRELT